MATKKSKDSKDTAATAYAKVKAESAKKLALARSSIAKACDGQKPVQVGTGQHPFIGSGSIIVNNLVGGTIGPDGRPVCPGYPRRRITEIYGPEASGKTTLALEAVKTVQNAGGSAAFLDFEHALDYRYAKAIGVKFDETFDIFAPDTLEQGFKMVFVMICAGVDVVVVDSVAAMVPAAEMAKSIDDAIKVGVVASKLAQTLPKVANWLAMYPKRGEERDEDAPGTALILLNQERATISTGPSYAPPAASSTGGKALKFYCSVRLHIQRVKTEKDSRLDPITNKKRDTPFGIVTKVKVIKDKLDGKAGQEGEIFIRYGTGVDDIFSVIEAAVANKIVKRGGSSYEFDQVKIIGRDKFRAYMIQNPQVYANLIGEVQKAILSGAMPVPLDDMADTGVEEQELIEVAEEVLDETDLGSESPEGD
jgi:recombination protein RecA